MSAVTQSRIELGGRRVDYRVVHSKAARKMRLRVGPDGLEVVQPRGRNGHDLADFLSRNEAWIVAQLERVDRLRRVRVLKPRPTDEILFRGRSTRVCVEITETRLRGNVVKLVDDVILIQTGPASNTLPARSLENWLRKQARTELELQLAAVTTRLGQTPGRVFVKGQRTKWGSCSARRNLSFNWRLILAPDFVLQYLVVHEVVHLAVPDHSAKFWLTVQSLCPEAQRAKHWLRANSQERTADLADICAG